MTRRRSSGDAYELDDIWQDKATFMSQVGKVYDTRTRLERGLLQSGLSQALSPGPYQVYPIVMEPIRARKEVSCQVEEVA
jgi:hypothetical protein